LLERSREDFNYLDASFANSQNRFLGVLKGTMLDQFKTYVFFILCIGILLAILSWNGLPYNDFNPENRFYLGFDIYNYLIQIITIYLLCMILWIQINIVLAFHRASKDLVEYPTSYNIFILRRNVEQIRRDFFVFLLYFIICISIINISFFGFNLIAPFNAAFLIMLFILGAIPIIQGINYTQTVMNKILKKMLDSSSNSLEKNKNRMMSLLAENSENGMDESNKLQKTLDIQQKDLELLAQLKMGFDLREAGTFVVSIIIPIISFIISMKQKGV
jgi:hypothetical protein